MKFRVETTAPSEADSESIYLWLSERSVKGAENWWKALLGTFSNLSRNAASYGLAPESVDHDEDIYEITFSTRHGNKYRVVYVIRSRKVHVLRVRGIGQPLLSLDEITFPD